MSEYINNASKRKYALKQVIRKLHQGQSVESLLDEFGDIVKSATSADIADAEKEMIAEGTPVEDIQQLCDLHVAVFRSGLENEPSPESSPGHPVYDFRIENEVIIRLMDTLADLVQGIRQGEQKALTLLQNSLQNLKLIEQHYDKKENLWFPILEKYGFEGPATVMWGVDNEIRTQIQQFIRLAKAVPVVARDLHELYTSLDTAVREMVYKEEKVLIPEAIKRFSNDEWAMIAAEGKRVYQEEAKIEIEPAAVTEVQASLSHSMDSQAVDMDLLPLSTGALSLEQINMMLMNLPVDITFVDENDEVRFFSQTRERIFTRTAAIIGRKVQKCHPPQSVHVVQKILDEFRSGKREVAEFWIEMGGKFLHIRYFALRDISGNYKGTIEVTQDVTGIRALQGEKRLLDD